MITFTSQKCKKLHDLFRVKTIAMKGGERIPILIKTDDGQPIYFPTIYSTTILRGKCQAFRSIEQALRSIMMLYFWAERENIDIESRIRTGEFLTVVESDSLAAFFKLNMKHIDESDSDQTKQPSKIISIEKARSNTAKEPTAAMVNGSTMAARIMHVRDYLNWLAIYSQGRILSSKRDQYDSGRILMFNQLDARKASGRTKSTIGEREGLDEETVVRLLDAITPESQENPWLNKGIKVRNQLAIVMLYTLGMRISELLGLKNKDINLQKNILTIKRAADDIEDPRVREPNTKTYDRELVLDVWLAIMIKDYIINYRRTVKNANKHPFLFVDHHSGRPLSYSAANKIFTTLRDKVPGIPRHTTAHVLRHTWNDTFSNLCDQQGITEAEEQKLRSYQMGWSETSGTASNYTKRSTRKRAQKLGLKMQEDALKRLENGKDEGENKTE